VSPGFLVACALRWVAAQVSVTDSIALAAAVISLVALYFAARSATASVRSATASEVSATASEDAVAEARAARHRAERPVFDVISDGIRGSRCMVRVTMIDGPTQIAAEIDYIGEVMTLRGPGFQSGHLVAGQGSGEYELFKGRSIAFGITHRADAVEVSAKVIMRCREVDADEAREWHHVEHVAWKAPAPEMDDGL